MVIDNVTITSKNFSFLLPSVLPDTLKVWETDGDLPVIGMAGKVQLTDGRWVALVGWRDVGARTGHPPRLVVEEDYVLCWQFNQDSKCISKEKKFLGTPKFL